MIYFIDGFQGVGKTTLINLYQSKNNCDIYKFEFSNIFNKFLTEPDIVGYQTGKDFSLLSFLKHIGYNKNIIIDRGPISTCIYSLLMGRFPLEIVDEYIRNISLYTNDIECRFILVSQNNRVELQRKHMDGFDCLETQKLESAKEMVVEQINRICKKYNIPLYNFVNDFSKPIKDNYKEFEKLLS